jgi:3-oxoacyl-[acyl-carrier-protein] synthase II
MSRFILFAYKAALEAAQHSGLDIESIAEQVGVEIGSGIGGIEVLERMTLELHLKGPDRVSPFTVPMMIVDMASGYVSMKLGAKGPNSSAVSACASANHAMGNAYRMIQNGDALAIITGGAESAICPIGLASFCAARSLSQDNDNPTKASRPFERDRNGFVMGEGAGILVFEELEHALKRNATIYGEIIGFASSGDAYHITAPAPEGEGAARAMIAAMKSAGIAPSDIDYINAHGTSTKLNDKNETAAMKTALGDHAYSVSISSTKSMTGHLLGAAGAIELIACLKASEEGIVPPTINFDNPDPDCDLDYTPNKVKERDVQVYMSNSFGFGGHNASIIGRKYTA